MVCTLLAVGSQTHSAPSVPPGAIDAFNSASPAQQRALADQYGVRISDVQAALSGQKSNAGSEENQPTGLGADGTVLKQAAPVVSADAQKDEVEVFDRQEPKKQEIASVLPRFGSGIFDEKGVRFAPVDNLPVPEGYILGVGDHLVMVLYGKDNFQTELTINREGSINFPRLGPIFLAGMRLIEARDYIESRVKEQLIGTKVVVSLGRLRSINVFMAGEVRVPGSHSVSALTTITQSIYIAGGISEIGSYRNIQVRRSGETVATLDLYDLLLRGSLADDTRLQTGDVVFVPATLPRVGVRGEVLRSAQFEVRPGETLADVLAMAGGPTSQAYLEAAVLQRRDPARALPELLNLNLRSTDDLAQAPLDGDLLTIKKLSDRIENPIALRGAFERPGLYAWRAGDRLSSFIRGTDGYLKPEADREIGVIVRRLNDRLHNEIFAFAPYKVLLNPGSEDDYRLAVNDEVYIFDQFASRSSLLAPAVSVLELQATQSDWPKVVTIRGAIDNAGKYPLGAAKTIAGLLRLVGGESIFNLNVDLQIGLIVRRKGSLNRIEAIPFNLGDALNDPESGANPSLAPLDEILIFNQVESKNSNRLALMTVLVDQFKRQATVDEAPQVMTIEGRVRFPGEYPILATDNLAFLIDLAGGFAEGAYTKNAEIVRVSIDGDQEIETEIIGITLDSEETLGATQLKSRDALRVNTVPGWSEQNKMTLSGEVKFPGVYKFEKGETLGAVIRRAGGLTEQAFVAGAVFTNVQAANNQKKQALVYFSNLRQQEASKRLIDTENKESVSSEVIDVLESAITGRVAIDLEAILSGDERYEVSLQNGDSLMVPKKVNYVAVVGDVYAPGNFTFLPDLTVQDYIELSGSTTRYADRKKAFVVKSDGRVVRPSGNAWFSGGNAKDRLAEGDVIVVPNNPDYLKSLDKWQSVSAVVFQSFASIAAFFSIADR